MPRNLAASAFLVVLVASASGAQAASQKLWNSCAGNDADAAITACTKILAGKESTQNTVIAFTYRGSAYSRNGYRDRAIADYDRAIELDPKYTIAFTNRGSVYFRERDYDRAIADFTRAIELDPKLAEAFETRGWAYDSKGDYDRAIADFTRAIELDPKNAVTFSSRGLVYGKIGKFDLARADVEKALALEPDDVWYKSELVELEKAEASAKALVTSAQSPPTQQAATEAAKPPIAVTPSPPQQQAAVEPVKPAIEAPAPAATPALSPATVPLGKRVALVIGNSDYRNIGRLDNPANDARLIADALKELNFEVVGGGAQLDLDKSGFDNAVQEFGSRLQGADVGLFYYAGHGVQVRGANYLAPVNANPTKDADVDFQMVDANVVLRQMESAGTKLNLVMLDACRNNPFAGRGLRAGGGGLAQMQAPEGTLISFATQPGNIAQDGLDGNSPYTKVLAEIIRTPGLDVFQTFNQVGLKVKKATGGAQQPWLSSSPIEGVFYFKPGL